jgi:hypothetical protein
MRLNSLIASAGGKPPAHPAFPFPNQPRTCHFDRSRSQRERRSGEIRIFTSSFRQPRFETIKRSTKTARPTTFVRPKIAFAAVNLQKKECHGSACGVQSQPPKIAGRPAGLLQATGRLKNRQRKNHSHHTNHHNFSTFLRQKTPRFPRFKPQESSKQTEATRRKTRNLGGVLICFWGWFWPRRA